MVCRPRSWLEQNHLHLSTFNFLSMGVTSATPLYEIINSQTRIFSPPLSDLTRDGTLNLLIASLNRLKTVSERLLVEQCKNTIILEKPSIPPWRTILHRIKMWWPSICQREFGPGILYTLRWIACCLLKFTPRGSTHLSDSRILRLCIFILFASRCPWTSDNPQWGWSCLNDWMVLSRSVSLMSV